MKLFVRTRYITFFFFSVFVFCEGYLRVFKQENLLMHHYPRIYAFDQKTGYKGIPNAEGYIRMPGIENRVKLNAYGFNDRNVTPGHPDSIFRIIVSGASLVEGIWSHQRETVVSLLNQRFRSAGYRVEVVNCGISGPQRDLQNLELCRESTQRFKPNLVLFELSLPLVSVYYARESYLDYSILCTGNNLKEYEHSRWVAAKKVDRVKQHKFITDLFDLCYCTRFICKQYEDGFYWGTMQNCYKVYAKNLADSWQYYGMDNPGLGRSVGLLNDFADTIRGMNAGVVAFECRNGAAGMLHDSSLRTSFPILSLGLDLGDRYVLQPDGHLNFLGDSVLADGLFSRLKEYIPGSFRPKAGQGLVKN